MSNRLARIKEIFTDRLRQESASPLLTTRADGVYKIPLNRELVVSYR